MATPGSTSRRNRATFLKGVEEGLSQAGKPVNAMTVPKPFLDLLKVAETIVDFPLIERVEECKNWLKNNPG